MSEDWGVFYNPELPVAAPAPEELQGPGSSPAGNLAAKVLANASVGNDIVEMLGLYLASDARLNIWYGEGAGKIKPSGMELAEIRVFSANLLHRVYGAWKSFEKESQSGKPVQGSVYHGLLHALNTAVFDTCSRMGETLADFGNHEA